MEGIKRCRACLYNKSVEDFYKFSKNSDGYNIKCKSCHNKKESIKAHKSFIDRTGEVHTTNQGYKVTIIESFSARNCTIQFENGYVKKLIKYDIIKKGKPENPYHPSVCGIGYIGVGRYSPSNKKIYRRWVQMIGRCYSIKEQEKRPTYKNVTVCEEWYDFQNFAEWFYKNYKEGFELDKDILIKGNKIYSPQTCCFVPSQINNLFIKNNKMRGEYPIGVTLDKRGNYVTTIYKYGKPYYLGRYTTLEKAFNVYKLEKEKHIKIIADEWKDKIEENVYQAMYNWIIEIKD